MASVDYVSNLRVLILYRSTKLLMIIMPVIVPIFKSKGLNMEQIFILQAVFSVAVAILELPSGYISDLFSRKHTLMFSAAFYFLGELGFLLSDNFLHLIVAELLLAFGLSLYSGTDVSMVYDSLSNSREGETKDKSQAKYLSNVMFWGLLGEALGGLIGGGIATYGLNYVLIVNAVVSGLPFVVSFFLVEPPRKKMSRKSHIKNFKYIYNELFVKKPFVRQILLLGIAYSVAAITAIWSYQELWQVSGISIGYFGYIWAAVNLAGAFSSKFAYRIEAYLGVKRTIYLMGLWPILMYFVLGLGGVFAALFACVAFQMLRGFNSVVLKDALNSRVGAEYRATANSIFGLGFRLCFAVIGPLFGLVIDHWGLHSAYLGFSGLFVLVFVFVLLPIFKYQDEFRHENSA